MTMSTHTPTRPSAGAANIKSIHPRSLPAARSATRVDLNALSMRLATSQVSKSLEATPPLSTLLQPPLQTEGRETLLKCLDVTPELASEPCHPARRRPRRPQLRAEDHAASRHSIYYDVASVRVW